MEFRVLFGWLELTNMQATKISNWVDPKDKSGEFKRGASVFRNHISREAGAEFPAEKGRYHLYVSYACPWGMYSLFVLLMNPLLTNASTSHFDRKEVEGSRGHCPIYRCALAHGRKR